MPQLLKALISPRKAAEQIATAPHWVLAFLLFSLVSIICYAVVHPSLVHVTLNHLPPSATDADKQVVVETLQRELPTRLAFLPIRLFIGWSTFSFVLMHVCRAFAPRKPVRFRQILSLEIHSEVTLVLANVVTTSVILIANTDPSYVPFSIAAILGYYQSFIIKSLLTTLNIFTLWYIVVLTTGVSVLCGFRKFRSFCIVMLVWILSVVFNLGALKLIRDELHLLL